jgi:branched-chain amino acid aminotransferase
MIHRYVYHNNSIVPVEAARLSPGQAGLLSGWGLFTTLRVYRGQPFAFERHWQRLEKDAGRTGVPLPFEAAKVRASLLELIARNEVREGTTRIYIIYNKVGFWQGPEELPQADLLMCTAGLPAYREPVRLCLAPHARYAASPLAGVKVTSWLPNVWQLQEAQRRGFDEALLLNERGEVAECTSANLFCFRDGRVLTPPLSSGCLQGVTRSILLEIAPPAGLPISEQALRPEDLYSASEVFITSTNRSLIAVGEIEGHTVSSAPGPVTQKLEALFAGFMDEYLARLATTAPGR